MSSDLLFSKCDADIISFKLHNTFLQMTMLRLGCLQRLAQGHTTSKEQTQELKVFALKTPGTPSIPCCQPFSLLHQRTLGINIFPAEGNWRRTPGSGVIQTCSLISRASRWKTRAVVKGDLRRTAAAACQAGTLWSWPHFLALAGGVSVIHGNVGTLRACDKTVIISCEVDTRLWSGAVELSYCAFPGAVHATAVLM